MEDYTQILSAYRRMRAASRALNSRMLGALPKGELERAARRLGVWSDGSIVMDDAEQLAVVMDVALHDSRQGGRNVVQRYVAEHPATPGSDEAAVMAAKERAFFSLFQVVDRIDGVGVHVQDVLRDREHFVADMGFSETAAPGCVIAARMLPFEGFLMTTGAALLASATVPRRTADTLDVNRLLPEDVRALPEDVWCQLAPMILGACLHSDGTGHITYEDVPGGPGTAGPETGGRVGPNEQRPCGNGRKYKKCCGRR